MSYHVAYNISNILSFFSLTKGQCLIHRPQILSDSKTNVLLLMEGSRYKLAQRKKSLIASVPKKCL